MPRNQCHEDAGGAALRRRASRLALTPSAALLALAPIALLVLAPFAGQVAFAKYTPKVNKV